MLVLLVPLLLLLLLMPLLLPRCLLTVCLALGSHRQLGRVQVLPAQLTAESGAAVGEGHSHRGATRGIKLKSACAQLRGAAHCSCRRRSNPASCNAVCRKSRGDGLM